MVNKKSIAARYADALFGAALDVKAERLVWSELEWFIKLLLENESFNKAMKHPLPAKMKLRILAEVLDKRSVHNIINNLLVSLIKNRRIALFEEITQQYYELMQQHQGIETLVVESSKALGEEVTATISVTLASKINKKINIKNRINKSLLGGMVFKHGSLVLDCSMRAKIEKLKEVLMHAPL